MLTRNEIFRDAILGDLAVQTCARLDLPMPPDVLIVINRGVYDRLIEHDLLDEEGVRGALDALETVSSHLQETEARWSGHGARSDGWWWGKISTAFEMYFRSLDSSTGIMIAALERRGLAPPRPDELGLG